MDTKLASKRAESVKVIVRCRPLSSKEKEEGYEKVVAMDVARGTVFLHKRGAETGDAPPREFTFDAVYDDDSKQVDLYDETFRPIVDAVLEGYNGTIFAYGQTGTGKTYTMEGVRGDPELQGVIPSSFNHIFKHISHSHNEQYLVRASYLEIYQEEIRDLLSKNHKHRLELKERPDTGVYVRDLSSFVAKSVREIEHVMGVGNQNRAVGRTNMNEHSSRSHAIFIVTVECSAVREDGEDHIRMGKLNLVDLAGSERQSKTGATGERLKEATKINLSLSALGNVISALVDGKSTHIPYRDSRLTRLLQDSLGGNAKTVMVANVGPASYNYEETLTTLRYANRAKNIKNQPKINEDPKDALLREFQDEINRLKHALEKRKVGKVGGTHRKKKKAHENGEVVSEDESEEEEEEEQEEGSKKNEKEELETKKALLEEEKQAIMQNKGLLEEEREKLMAELQRRANEIKKEEEKRYRLETKIKMMESKLLAGENTILDQHEQQKQDLERQRQEMIKQQQLERQIKQELEQQEESRQEIEGVYNSLAEEVASKEKKLKKLLKKKKDAEVEIAEYREEQVRMREELTVQLEELHKQLKLRLLVVENFIPRADMERVASQAVFDEADDMWKMKPVEPKSSGDSSDILPRPMAIPGSLRPMCIYTRLAEKRGDLLLLGENVIRLQLDMPTRTTQNYEGPLVAPTVKAVLDKALESEEDIVVDASTVQHLPFKRRPRKHQTSSRSSSEREVQSRTKEELAQPVNPREHFPTSRGLVTSRARKYL